MKFRAVKPTRARRHQRRRRPRRHRGARRRPARRRARAPAARCSRTSASRATGRCCARQPGTSATSETRRRGTVGGSLAFAAPWAELTAAAVALDAAIDVRSTERRADDRGARVLPRPATRRRSSPGELVVAVRFPARGAAIGRRVPRGQRALPRLRPGGGRGGRLARRDGSGGRRARPAARRADAVPRRHATSRGCARRRRRSTALLRADRRRRTTSRSPARTGGGSRPCSPAARCATPLSDARRESAHDRDVDAAHRGQRPLRTRRRSSRGGRWPTSSARTSA